MVAWREVRRQGASAGIVLASRGPKPGRTLTAASHRHPGPADPRRERNRDRVAPRRPSHRSRRAPDRGDDRPSSPRMPRVRRPRTALRRLSNPRRSHHKT
ncbi:Hypothetical protein A7982_02815 [Minicystis rosea]|nr:Hypothetical protein A7982_02815 [Minicystis rosea]